MAKRGRPRGTAHRIFKHISLPRYRTRGTFVRLPLASLLQGEDVYFYASERIEKKNADTLLSNVLSTIKAGKGVTIGLNVGTTRLELVKKIAHYVDMGRLEVIHAKRMDGEVYTFNVDSFNARLSTLFWSIIYDWLYLMENFNVLRKLLEYGLQSAKIDQTHMIVRETHSMVKSVQHSLNSLSETTASIKGRVEVLPTAALLQELLNELLEPLRRELHALSTKKQIIEAESNMPPIPASMIGESPTSAVQLEKELPAFVSDNPWLDVLSRRKTKNKAVV